MNSIYSLFNIFSEIRRSLRLAFPLITSEMIYAINGFITTIMIAHLGKAELAANALVWGVFIGLLVFFIGIYCAVGILVSQSYGAKDSNGISICFKQGLILASLLSIPMMFIVWISPVILKYTGQSPEVIAYATPYFYALIWSMLPFGFLFVMEQFLIGLSKTRLVMLMSVLQCPVQIFLNYVFLFGKFGCPRLGLPGVAYGMSIVFYFVAISFICYLYFSKSFKEYHLFKKWWKINKTFLFELIRVGLPLGCIYCVEVAFFAVVAFMMGRLGTTTLAAYQISYQFMMIGLGIVFALTQCASVRVGQEVGRNNKPALKLATYVNIGIAFCFMLMFSIPYLVSPRTVIGIDIDVHSMQMMQVAKEASSYLIIVAILLFEDAIRLTTFGALRGMKDTKFPLVASIIGFWCIAFSTSYFFGFKLHFGGAGIWWGVFIGLSVAAIILVARFHWLVKRVDLANMVTK